MADEETVHPEAGADEDQKIWDALEKADREGAAPDLSDAGDGGDPGGASTEEPTDPSPDAATAATDKPAEQGTGQSAPDAGDDPWESAPDNLRAAHQATRQELEASRSARRRAEGTVSGLQRKINELSRELEKVTKGGKPSGTDNGTAPNDIAEIFADPELKKAEDEYPEVIGPLRKTIERLSSHLDATITARTKQTQEFVDSLSAANQEKYYADQEKVVLDAHSDYGQIAKSDAFQEWYERAPTYLKAGVERNAQQIVDGQEVAHIVKMFKQETGWRSPSPPPANAGNSKPAAQPNPKRQQQLESASTPRGKGPARVSRDEPPKDGDEQAIWDYYERKDREKARAAH